MLTLFNMQLGHFYYLAIKRKIELRKYRKIYGIKK